MIVVVIIVVLYLLSRAQQQQIQTLVHSQSEAIAQTIAAHQGLQSATARPTDLFWENQTAGDDTFNQLGPTQVVAPVVAPIVGGGGGALYGGGGGSGGGSGGGRVIPQ